MNTLKVAVYSLVAILAPFPLTYYVLAPLIFGK